MERRFLLAFLLSFLVLSVWSYLFPAPKKSTESSQVVVNKEVASTEGLPTLLPAAQPEAVNKSEKVTTLENDHLTVDFSTVGGSIKKITVKDFNIYLPVDSVVTQCGKECSVFNEIEKGERYIVYSGVVNGLRFLKRFELDESGYKIELNTKVENISSEEKSAQVDFGAFTLDDSRMDKNVHSDADKSLMEYSIAKADKVFLKGNAHKFSKSENVMEEQSVRWVGFRNRYFCLIVKPTFVTSGYQVKVNNEKSITVGFNATNVKIAPGNSVEYKVQIYNGPQDMSVLKGYGLGFEEIMKFSSFGIIDFISKVIYFLLHEMYKVVKNWGLCIIGISVFLYLLTYPLTFKSMMSMKKMQAIQPELTKLREQHKNNPQKLNKEMMELYKKYKVNPLGGCLPILLQAPIFLGLYQVLWRSVSFKGAHFLWIKDLSEADRLIVFPTSFPVIGNELNILPLLMMVVMFFQQKLTSKNMVVMDPAQVSQQKMMAIFMPLMIGFLFYKFASGLSLYFTIFYLLSTLSQWKMSKIKVAP